MPQAEHILEKVALNEVSALPWKWIRRDEEEWRAVFQIPDDSGLEHEVQVIFDRATWIPPQTNLRFRSVDATGKSLTKTSSGQTGPKGLSVYTVSFFTDARLDRDNLAMKASFAKIAVRVFATVAAVIRAFVKEIQPDVLNWGASTDSRASIYKRMMKREKVPGYVEFRGTKYAGYMRADSPLAR